ncbi:transcriptional repressor DicA [Dorea longicatena]|nr:transcriptional repressor DicA [Dorea longicatena]
MKDKELRKLIGSRAKQRRLELNLTQPYVAEKMGVTASTILRYENGSIDNTKKMVLEGLSEALHVSIEWLRGETDEYETDITDKKELQIRDAMGNILKQLPLDLSKKEDAFSKDLLLLMLKQYNLFLESFQFACKNYKGNTNEADIAKENKGLKIFYQKFCMRIPIRYRTTTGVMIYLHARSISSVPIV